MRPRTVDVTSLWGNLLHFESYPSLSRWHDETVSNTYGRRIGGIKLRMNAVWETSSVSSIMRLSHSAFLPDMRCSNRPIFRGKITHIMEHRQRLGCWLEQSLWSYVKTLWSRCRLSLTISLDLTEKEADSPSPGGKNSLKEETISSCRSGTSSGIALVSWCLTIGMW